MFIGAVQGVETDLESVGCSDIGCVSGCRELLQQPVLTIVDSNVYLLRVGTRHIKGYPLLKNVRVEIQADRLFIHFEIESLSQSEENSQ